MSGPIGLMNWEHSRDKSTRIFTSSRWSDCEDQILSIFQYHTVRSPM